MKRHPFSFFSLVAGVWLVLCGAALVQGQVNSYRDVVWLGPALLVALGASILVGTIRRAVRGRNDSWSPSRS